MIWPAPLLGAAAYLRTAVATRRLEAAFWQAVGEGRVSLAYQPKLDLRQGRVAGLEALLRWQDRARQAISPVSFIPPLEGAHALDGITSWVLARALEDQQRLARDGQVLPVAINVPAYLIGRDHFHDEVLERARDAAAPITIEITESSVVANAASARAQLRRLSANGLGISIDDYGAGLSSLSYLRDFPASELKIDRTFITELASCHRNPLIVRSTIDLAHALDMQVVAEGVESTAALALLRVMGCDMAQGYAIARPLPLPELAALLASGVLERLIHDMPRRFIGLPRRAPPAPVAA